MLTLSSKQAESIHAAFHAETKQPRSQPASLSLSLHVPPMHRTTPPATRQQPDHHQQDTSRKHSTLEIQAAPVVEITPMHTTNYNRRPPDCVMVSHTPEPQNISPTTSTHSLLKRPSSTESAWNMRQNQFSVRLTMSASLFVCNALILAITNATITTTAQFWVGGLISGPVFSTALLFMTLSSQNIAVRVSGFTLLYTYPVVFLMLNQWMSWGFCLMLSAFISYSHSESPFGHHLLSRLSWAGFPFVAIGGAALIVIKTPIPIIWGAMIAVMCLQLMLGISRLQASNLIMYLAR